MSIDFKRSAPNRRRLMAPGLLFAMAALLQAGVAYGQQAADPKPDRLDTIIGFVADPVACLKSLNPPEKQTVAKELLMPGGRPIKAAKVPSGHYEIPHAADSSQKCYVRGGALLIERTDPKPVGACAPVVIAQNRAGGTRGASEGCR